MYNIVEKVYPEILSSDHIAEFPIDVNGTNTHWRVKQDAMYRIKNECTRQGLRNGTDYLFVNPAITDQNYRIIQVWFRDATYVSYMSMWKLSK